MTNGTSWTFLKASRMTTTQDGGFASAEEDFFEDIHSPTDNSEDSVEVKISPISLKNKRKCSEPRKMPETFSGPLKKRMCLKVKSETSTEIHPFRPWSPKKCDAPLMTTVKQEDPGDFVVPKPPLVPLIPVMPVVPVVSERVQYFRPPSPISCEPMALVKRQIKQEDCPVKEAPPRVPLHPEPTHLTPRETQRLILQSNEVFPALRKRDDAASKREQRNYKNMTRERRIEANARERTRVHTISAAFDTLRKSIPSYSHNQKLSKLSVLRIACSYIMTLSSIANDSDSEKISDCVDYVTKTIQREGKLRKKKDDND